MKGFLNKCLSLFKKKENLDDIEPIEAEMNFECKPGEVTVEKVLLKSLTTVNPEMFYYNRLFSRFNGLVLFNSATLTLLIVAKEFNAENRTEATKEVLSLLDNPPEGLTVLTMSPEEYERIKPNVFPTQYI